MAKFQFTAKGAPACRPKTPVKKPMAAGRTPGGTAAQRILSAIKTASVMKKTDSPTRELVATIAGFPDPKSSTVAHAYTKLKNEKLILCNSKTVSLTDAGSEAAGPVSLVNTSEPIHDAFKKKLKGLKPRQIFEILLDGRAVDRETIADTIGTNVKSSTFAHALTPLRKLGLLEEVGDKTNPKRKRLRLTDSAFPFGRPKSSDSACCSVISDNIP